MPDQTTDTDGDLVLTDEGLELPEFLRGYTGEFKMHTASVTGTVQTTDTGLPDAEFYDGPVAVYPDDGEYNDDLSAGMMAFETSEHDKTVFNIIDERTNGGDAA